MRKIPLATLSLAAVFGSLASPAEAYLDPGTGSYVFQILAAALISGGFVLKTYWRRLRETFDRWRRPGSPKPPDAR